MHSYTAEERRSFSNYINQKFESSPIPGVPTGPSGSDLSIGILSPSVKPRYLPLDPESNDLFEKLKDGVLLCVLFNRIRPFTIGERKIIEQPRNHFEQLQNCTAALKAATDLGFSIINIGPEDIISGKPHLVLGLVWQIVRYDLLSTVTVEKHPEMIALIEPAEDVQTFVELTPEVNLLRWLNHHLRACGSERRVTNFSRDLADSEIYILLLSQLAPAMCDTKILAVEKDVERRAQYVIDSAVRLGCNKFIAPEDIVNGHWKLNLAFVAELFHKRNALHIDDEQNEKLREVEDLLQKKLREEEAQMRQRISEEEQKMRASIKKAEEEQRSRLALQEEENKKRWQEAQRRSTDENFVAAQTEPYGAPRRYSADVEARKVDATGTVAPVVPGVPGTGSGRSGMGGVANISNLATNGSYTSASDSTLQYQQIPTPPSVTERVPPPSGFMPPPNPYSEARPPPSQPPIPIPVPPIQGQSSGYMGSGSSFSSGSYGIGSSGGTAGHAGGMRSGGTGGYYNYQSTVTTQGGSRIVTTKQAYELRTGGYSGSSSSLVGDALSSVSSSSVPPPSNFILSPDSTYHPAPIVRTESFRAPPPPPPQHSQPSISIPQMPPPPPMVPMASGPGVSSMYSSGSNLVGTHSMPPGGGGMTMGMHGAGMQSLHSSGHGHGGVGGGGMSSYGYQSSSSSHGMVGYGMGRFPIRLLKIYIYEARHVAKKDLMGLLASDPYVVVERRGGMRKTRACKNTTRPVWYEEFEFPQVDDSEHIYVTVWDQDKFGKDDFLGQVILTKEDLLGNGERWYPLRSRPGSHDRVSGEIRIGIRAF